MVHGGRPKRAGLRLQADGPAKFVLANCIYTTDVIGAVKPSTIDPAACALFINNDNCQINLSFDWYIVVDPNVGCLENARTKRRHLFLTGPCSWGYTHRTHRVRRVAQWHLRLRHELRAICLLPRRAAPQLFCKTCFC